MQNPFRCLLLLACSATLCAQGITVPRMVNPADAPLYIISTNSNLTDFLNTVTFKNVSGRKITSFQLGIIMSVPAGCGPNQVFGAERLMQADRIVIDPNANAETYRYGFGPSDVEAFAAEARARVVQTQFTVVHVDFSDGGHWSYPRTGKIYDEALMAKDAEVQCLKPATALGPAPASK
jgi:hypothetical protein